MIRMRIDNSQIYERKNTMKIIKRSGAEEGFDISKIISAVERANKEVPITERLTREQIEKISSKVTDICTNMNHAVNVEEVQ